MARYYKVKDIWVPDMVTANRETTRLVDCPNLLENCWRLIYISCSVWLNKYRVFAYSKEEMEDIEHDAQIRAYVYLLEKVRSGSYRRDLSLYLNIRSCCQCAVGMYVHTCHTEKFKANRNTISLAHVDAENGEGWLSTLASESVPRMMTAWDAIQASKNRTRKPISDDCPINVRKASSTRVEARRRDEAYNEYVEDCVELGIDYISRDDFEQSNYGNVLQTTYVPRPSSGAAKSQLERTEAEREEMRRYWRESKRIQKAKNNSRPQQAIPVAPDTPQSASGSLPESAPAEACSRRAKPSK